MQGCCQPFWFFNCPSSSLRKSMTFSKQKLGHANIFTQHKWTCSWTSLTYWLLELFAENALFGHFGAFKLDLDQISFNPVENKFATQQLAFLATWVSCFTTLCLVHAQKSKFWDFEFLDKKVTYVFMLFHFWNFFLPSEFLFSPFLFFLLQWLTFYWACLWLKNC